MFTFTGGITNNTEILKFLYSDIYIIKKGEKVFREYKSLLKLGL